MSECSCKDCSYKVYKENKCILHCEKNEGDWYDISSDGTKIWNQEKVKGFWDFYNKKEGGNNKNLKIPPLLENKINFSINIEYSDFLDDFKIKSNDNFIYNEIDIKCSSFLGDFLIDTVKAKNYTNPNVQISLQNIEKCNKFKVIGSTLFDLSIYNANINDIDLGREEKNEYLFSNKFTNIQIYNDNGYKIKNLSLNNSFIDGRLELNDIEIENINCNNSVFKEKCEIKNTIITENVSFKNSVFRNLADFYNSTFFSGEDMFYKTNFQDISVFTKCTFKNDINFKYTTFEKLSQFKETTFENKVNFEDSIIKEEINFLRIKKDDKKSDIEVANRETARIIKHSFEKQDNIIEANKFYALEMKKQESELKWTKDFAEKLIFKFHKISSNHSQDWLLVLLWILNITFVYSAFNQELCLDIEIFYALSFYCLLFPILLIEYCVFLELKGIWKFFTYSLYILGSYFIYGFLTFDFELYCVSNDFNPFSIMNGKDKLTFITLLYKVTIAYLLYQLIVSIRQNTRRK